MIGRSLGETADLPLPELINGMGNTQTGEVRGSDKEGGCRQEDIREKVEERCRAIMREVEDASLAIEQELQVQLMKIPKKVRTMPLSEFQSVYGGDFAAAVVGKAVKEPAGQAPAALMTAPRTGRRGMPATSAAAAEATPAAAPQAAATVGRSTHKRQAAEPHKLEEPRSAAQRAKRACFADLQTPGPNAAPTPAAPRTTARMPAPGEVVYSQRGSPVLVPSTAVHPAAHSRIPVPQQQAAATGPGLVLTTCTRARTAARTTAARKNQTAASKSKSEEELVAHGITLTTSDGRQVPLEGGLDHLPDDLRNEAAQQLKNLKGIVDSLLGAGEGAKGKSAGDEGAEDSKGFVGASSKVNEENPAEPAEISMLGDSPGCKSMAMRNVKSGKFIIIVTDRSEASWTQPVPGHKGSHFYVAKVLRRDGGLIKIQYYATEGANRRWFEGRGVDNKHYLEERDVDPGEIVAVFDGLTKKDKKLPVAVMDKIRNRLEKAPATPA